MFFPLNNLTLARLYAYNVAVVFPNRQKGRAPYMKNRILAALLALVLGVPLYRS